MKHGGGKIVGTPKLLLKAPITKILESLKKAKFIRLNEAGSALPQGLETMVNLSHYEIVTFYNSKIRGILNFYSFASNRNNLRSIIWLLTASCALTLARKLKLRTMKKVFSRFGKNLTCPETGVGLENEGYFGAIHDFKASAKDPNSTMHTVWAGKLTQSSFGKTCAICGSPNDIEMHHYRSVRKVRARYKKGDSVQFAQFEGAIKRKQIPLCEYHHKLYHKGSLTAVDLKKIADYR